MADAPKTDAEDDAEDKANIERIEDADAMLPIARGNVHSEAGDPAQYEAPPPLPI